MSMLALQELRTRSRRQHEDVSDAKRPVSDRVRIAQEALFSGETLTKSLFSFPAAMALAFAVAAPIVAPPR
jgi:hypothetical protein